MVKHTRDLKLFAMLVYFTQGAIGISGVALPLYLRSLRWPVSEIAFITSAAAFPWLLKILYGFLSDTYPLFGFRRKSYLWLSAILAASGWLLLAILPPEKKWIFLAMVLSNTGFAATDVITDGLIVEHSTRLSSSIYQSLAWGSRSLGSVVSGVLGGWLASHWQPHRVFILTMLLPLTVSLTILWLHEKRMASGPFTSPAAPLKKCFSLILGSNLKNFTVILFLVSISSAIGMPLFFHMKESLKFNATFLGLLTSLGWAGAMLGSFIYAKWLRNVPPHTTLRGAILLNSLSIFGTLLVSTPYTAFISLFLGGIMACLVMLPMMSQAAALTRHTGIEGTLFAVLMSIFNLGQILFGYMGGRLFEKIGMTPLILVTGSFALSGLYFVRRFQVPPTLAPEGA